MARKIEVEILGDSRSLERAFLRSSRSGSSFASGISKAGLAAGAGLAAFSVAAVKGVQAASNLEEQVNRAGVVFEENAAAVQAWSRTTAAAFGISRRAALEAAGGFGQMLQTAGVLPKDSAEMSKALVELGADLASFNNIDPTEALDKLRSGLAGEAEPLRRLGVFLSEARVKQEAYRLGIAETGDELTEAQKVQARYSLILADTTKAQGDFARTSDSLANSQRRVSALFEDAAARLSGSLLPAIAEGADKLAGLIEEFSAARTIEAKFGVVISNAADVAESIAAEITDAVGRIDWGDVFERTTGLAEGLQERVEEIDFSFVGEEIGNAFSDAAKVALPAAKELADRIGATIRAIDFEDLGRELGPGLASAMVTAVATLLDPAFWARNWDLALGIALTAFGGPIGRFAGKAAGLLVSSISGAVARFSPRLAAAFTGLALQSVRLFGAALGNLTAILGKALAPLTGLVGGVFKRLGRLATFTAKVLGITAVINALSDLAGEVGKIFGGMARSIAGVFDRAFDYVVRKTLELVEDVLGITSFLGKLDPFRGMREDIQKRLEEMKGDVGVATTAIQRDLDSLKGPKVTVTIATVVTGEGPGAGETTGDARGSGTEAGKAAAAKIVGAVEQTTKIFRDAAKNAVAKAQGAIDDAKKRFPDLIDSMRLDLDRASATAGFGDDLRVLSAIEGAIREQMRIEGETTDLARQLFDVRQERAQILEQQADSARQAWQDSIDAIELRVSQAEATKGFADDIARNTELQTAIRGRIRTEGATTELLSMLFAAQEKRRSVDEALAEQARAQTQTAQFRALGLTGEGDKPTPTIANLRKQLGSLEENVEGTILDTPKTAALFNRARKVLAGQWGKATEETRDKIREFLATLRGELEEGGAKGPLTPTVAIDTSKIAEGLNLSPDQIRELRGRLAGFNSAGAALAGGTVAAAGASVVAPSAGAQSFSFDLYIDGEPVAASVIPRIQRRNNRTPALARGRHSGRSGI